MLCLPTFVIAGIEQGVRQSISRYFEKAGSGLACDVLLASSNEQETFYMNLMTLDR